MQKSLRYKVGDYIMGINKVEKILIRGRIVRTILMPGRGYLVKLEESMLPEKFRNDGYCGIGCCSL